MKVLVSAFVLGIVIVASAVSQTRTPQHHKRGMLHQTVFNTGELGRAYDRGDNGMIRGHSSMEWPPNSSLILDGYEHRGSHNSIGGGLYISAFVNGVNQMVTCGAVTTSGNGQSVPVAGVYVNPGTITRSENYPLLPDGKLNPAYNPNEAEEIIIAQWTTIGMKIQVTRTSRAWSIPGYNSFIIYEYELVNIDTVDYLDGFVGWGYGFTPSMFGLERTFNRWAEGDVRNYQYARFDLTRWMSYNHDRTGGPDGVFFNRWSQPGDRGGLNSPQAVGIVPLHYDYNNLMHRTETNYPKTADSNYVWDANGKMKQPYTNRYENANNDFAKIQRWLDVTNRITSPFNGATDSTRFVNQFRADPAAWAYWKGRTKPSINLAHAQPAMRGYVFGPYKMPKNAPLRFAIAEVVGYGPGIASDSIYKDIGGNTRAAADAGFVYNPVPSWFKEISYANVAFSGASTIGSNYLQTNELPWYVTPGVVSIRDVADRAIQIYTGNPLVKWDSLQFEPKDTPPTGAYNTIPITIPAPVITIENTGAAVNKLTWTDQVELFTASRLNAPFSHYKAYRASGALGPWQLIDSIGAKDPRYWRDSLYLIYDRESNLGQDAYYAVFSVDTLGQRSGLTNFTLHNTQSPAALVLEKVWVTPNPLIVTRGGQGSSVSGEFTDKIGFMGLTKKCTIRIFSYSGQLLQTIEHDTPETSGYEQEWFQITRNNQMTASGVYFFTVDDAATGKRVTGKFVIIH